MKKYLLTSTLGIACALSCFSQRSIDLNLSRVAFKAAQQHKGTHAYNSLNGLATDPGTHSKGINSTASFGSSCAGANTLNFTGTYSSCPLANVWAWNFGDPASGTSNTAATQNISHTFSGPGSYTVTMIASGGLCLQPETSIQVVNIMAASVTSHSNVTCPGANNGSATASVTSGLSPVSYVWSPGGSNTASVTGLTQGIYTVSISDAGSCPLSATVSITQPPQIVITLAATPASCGSNNGSAVATSVTGGTGSFIYSWSPVGGSTTTASNLANGMYTLNVTDIGNNCHNTATVNVGAVPAIPFICTVTSDSLGLNNIIYWDNTLYSNVDSFIIFRYDAFYSSYLRIGAVSKDSGQFTDVQRNIGGPNGGDPQFGNWQYKLALRDTCGNISLNSPYHKSVFIQENSQNFNWSAYIVESGQSNPVIGYSFSRDDNSSGSWHVLVNTTGLSATDPNYLSFPSGNWRVEALGFSCTSAMRLSNGTMGAVVKAKSNITNNRILGNNPLTLNTSRISVYPNPSTASVNISSLMDLGLIVIYNFLGEVIYKEKINFSQHQIDLSKYPDGIYILQAQGDHIRLVKE